jgi:hypothetical protein
MNMEYIKTNLTLLPPEAGGRQTPLMSIGYGGKYRPHIVLGSPDQREAIIIEKDGLKNYIDEQYLGVAFWDGPSEKFLPTNKPIDITMALMYAPHEQYNDVQPGATFTLREGPRIIGYGKVNERWSESNA